MKILVILIAIISLPLYMRAQTTIGESKEEIRKLIQSDDKFKLLTGTDCDTLIFTQGMQTVFSYKNNICYKSTSIMPLMYMPAMIQKFTDDSYKKVKENVWIDAKQTIKVQITMNKNKKDCVIETTFFDKVAHN